MRWKNVTIGLALIVAACTPGSPDTAQTTTSLALTTTTRGASSEICLAGDLPFTESGLIAALGGGEGDASAVSDIRWDASATCERLTVTFSASSGAPAATLGPSAVSVIPYAGVVRIVLPPEVDRTAIADTILEGTLVHAAYVFRNDGVLAIDIHAVDGVPITARAFTTTSPASLVIDVARANVDAVPVGVTATSKAVVVNPTTGPNLYPLTVEGYVAPGLRSTHVQLLSDGDPVAEISMALGGDADAWQYFASTIDDGPLGSVVVFVGSVDGNGQPDSGARVSIRME